MERRMKKRESDNLEAAAWRELCRLRWGGNGNPVCPRCGATKPYWIRSRRYFKCSGLWCSFHFTPTTGTAFQQHKLPCFQLLRALYIYKRDKGVPNVSEFARELGVTWKVAHVLSKKIQASQAAGGPLKVRPMHWVGYWQPAKHRATT